jgi:hypothetical protein
VNLSGNVRPVLDYFAASVAGLLMCLSPVSGYELKNGAYEVLPSDDIQGAVDSAATNTAVSLSGHSQSRALSRGWVVLEHGRGEFSAYGSKSLCHNFGPT